MNTILSLTARTKTSSLSSYTYLECLMPFPLPNALSPINYEHYLSWLESTLVQASNILKQKEFPLTSRHSCHILNLPRFSEAPSWQSPELFW